MTVHGVVGSARELAAQCVVWMQARSRVRASGRRLRVVESVSLGEKRFVAVVEVDGKDFLLGGGAAGVALLSELAAPETFTRVMQKAAAKPRMKRAEVEA